MPSRDWTHWEGQVLENARNKHNQLSLVLHSACNAINRAYRNTLEQFDITYPQYLVLLALWYQDSISVKELSTQTLLDSSTLTPLLKRLEAKDLVTRSRRHDDERVRVICLTHKGRELERKAASIPANIQRRIGISATDEERLQRYCELIIERLGNNS